MKYTLRDKITYKGKLYTTKAKKSAHREADKAEKQKYGKRRYAAVERVIRALPKHELAGKVTKTGKILVSKKVPRKLRSQVAFNEKKYFENLKKKK